jgi:hypothetical protein
MVSKQTLKKQFGYPLCQGAYDAPTSRIDSNHDESKPKGDCLSINMDRVEVIEDAHITFNILSE